MSLVKEIQLTNSQGQTLTRDIGADSENIAYDNTSSGLTADNVQDAIDEIAQSGGGTELKYTIDGANGSYAVIQNATENGSVTIDGQVVPFTKNVASGIFSHAEGHNTTVSGNSSHVEGDHNSVIGNASHAEGAWSIAYGEGSHAEGVFTKAHGDYTHSEGYGTSAGYDYQHVSGKYNNNKSNTLFEIGNGTSSVKNNAFEVYNDGNLSTDNGTTKVKLENLALKTEIPSITGKADKVTSATNGNFAGLDENGNLTDSGKSASDFAGTGVATTSANGLMSSTDKIKIDGLGTASTKDVPTSGNASSSQVVMGDDTRLTDSRNAADVYSWAKAENKPTYTASEVGAISTTLKGTANGVAELDSTGKVPSSQLPSYVDDVLEYDTLIDFPLEGETSKIYIAKDTNKTYRWSGTAYVEISASLALGETSSTAYYGDKGKTAYDHATDSNRLTTAQSSGLYKFSTTAEGHIGSTTTVSKSDITALGIPAQDTTYGAATTAVDGLMSSSDKIKLDGIANGAEVNVQADWSVTDDTNDAFIKNKPTIPTVTGKADKVSGATEGNFASLDSNGNLADSGHKHSDYLTSHQDISGKADKVTSATNGNFAGLDLNGNLTDSGKKASDFQSKPTVYSESLTAGNTSVAFTGVSTTSNSKIDIATSQAGLDYNSLSVSGTTYTVTYDVQSSAVTVYLIITEVN